MKLRHLLPAVALLTIGCQAEPTADPPAAAQAPPTQVTHTAKVEYTMPTHPAWRPAHKEVLFAPLKADQYDDIRFAAPQYYSITVPPPDATKIRPMVEWEPMRAIVMEWPSSYLNFAQNASDTVAQIAKNAVTVAEVWFVTEPGGEAAIKTHLLDAGISQEEIDTKIRFMNTSVDSIWFIDSGPVPILNTETNTWALADFRYYHDRAYDDGISTQLGRNFGNFGFDAPTVTYRMPLSVEGGTFQSTTDGICITGNRQLYYMSCADGGCDQSIRSMPLDQVQTHPLAMEMKDIWGKYLGCKDIIVTNSITDDGTGHIDMYLKIVDDNTILLGDYREPYENTNQETNAARLDATAAFLEAYVKPDGSSFTVKRLIMPGHRSSNQGTVPFTYINSTFINGVNLWPATVYPDWEGSRDIAQAEWEEVLPEYSHVWIDATELSFWSGAIHCITRTIPEGDFSPWVEDGECVDGGCQAPAGGYVGTCQPNGVKAQVCWGPAWECSCNDCDKDCSQPSGCPAGLNYTGCCDGASLVFCEDSSVQQYDCEMGCGWAAGAGFYDCAGGQTNAEAGVEDPSGQDPRSCDDLFCTPDCEGKVCGDDGCGGQCGTCDGELTCSEGACVEPCQDQCTGGESGCDGETAWACAVGASGCTERFETDCAADGKVCKAGACFEPSGEDITGGPDAGGPDAGTDVSVTPKPKDDGCSGAPSDSAPWAPLAMLGLLVLAVTIRRRA